MTAFANAQRSRRILTSSVQRQRGVSIISVLLGLVIVGAVAIVIYNQFADSSRKSRVEAAQSEITTMIASAQKTYGNANQYGAVTTAISVQGGVIPERLRIAGTTTAQNRYNGPITMTPATITSANDSLVLGYGAVQRADCQDLVLGSDTLVRRMAVGGTEVKPADGVVDLPALAAACDGAPATALDFTFGRGQ